MSKREDLRDVPEARRRNMQAVRAKDTKPEMTVRRLLHGLGYRYRLHDPHLPGRPDLVFPSRRAVIEVRGCFWHHHADPSCKNAALPATRKEWWAEKLSRTVIRDARNEVALTGLGWKTLVIWECAVRASPDSVAVEMVQFLGAPGTSK